MFQAADLLNYVIPVNIPKRNDEKLVGNGGFNAYLGTNDMREVNKLVESGDERQSLYVKLSFTTFQRTSVQWQPFFAES